MDYIFDDNVLYRSDDGTIHVLETGAEDIVTLTPVLNRILLLLVSQQGQLITKEDFLAKVWDDYGKTGSSHTLNQYLSTLRGIFAKHLNKKAIITVPKQGYIFSLDIIITTVEHRVEQSVIVEPKEKVTPSVGDSLPEITPSAQNKIIPKNHTKEYVAFYFLLLLAVIALTLFVSKKSTPMHSPYFRIGFIENCPVFYLGKHQNEQQKIDAMVTVNKMADMYELTCADNIYFYFYHNENNKKIAKGVYSMLSQCQKTQVGHDDCLTTRVSW